MTDPLAARFLDVRGESTDDADSLRTLDGELRRLHRQAVEAWPDVELNVEAWIDHVASRVAPADLTAVLTDDLYLAAACARGDATAIRSFERAYFGEVARAVTRLGASQIEPAELEQVMREKLFVATEGRPPRVAQYTGRGPLRLWLRVAVARTLQNLAMRGPKETPLEQTLADDLVRETEDMQLEHMKGLYAEHFREAFARATGRLDVRERVLLHQHFAQRIPQARLAEAYEVHINTIARWLTRARQSLRDQIEQALSETLNLPPNQLQSVLNLARSRLDISLGRFGDDE